MTTTTTPDRVVRRLCELYDVPKEDYDVGDTLMSARDKRFFHRPQRIRIANILKNSACMHKDAEKVSYCLYRLFDMNPLGAHGTVSPRVDEFEKLSLQLFRAVTDSFIDFIKSDEGKYYLHQVSMPPAVLLRYLLIRHYLYVCVQRRVRGISVIDPVELNVFANDINAKAMGIACGVECHGLTTIIPNADRAVWQRITTLGLAE